MDYMFDENSHEIPQETLICHQMKITIIQNWWMAFVKEVGYWFFKKNCRRKKTEGLLIMSIDIVTLHSINYYSGIAWNACIIDQYAFSNWATFY